MDAELSRVGKVALPTLALALLAWSLGGMTWWLVLSERIPLWAGALAMVVPGYVAFTPMHEASHGNIGGRRRFRWLDAIAGWGAAAILFIPLPLFRSSHLRHHGNVNHPHLDPDMWVARAGALGIVAACYTFIFHYYWNFIRGAIPSPTQTRDRRAIGVGTCVILAVAATATALGHGREVLWLWFAPATLTGCILSIVFAWLPHQPAHALGRWTNSGIVQSRWLTPLLMAHNYHLIHHLWPRIPFHRYPVVFRARLDVLRRHGASIRG